MPGAGRRGRPAGRVGARSCERRADRRRMAGRADAAGPSRRPGVHPRQRRPGAAAPAGRATARGARRDRRCARRAARGLGRIGQCQEKRSMTSDLVDKVVLITGASTGIGAAAAIAFGGAGSRVVVHYNASRDAAEAVVASIRAAGGRADTVSGDVTRAEDVRRIVADTMALHGRLDVLVNNAGGMVGRVRIEDYSEAYLQQVLALNVVQVAMFMHEVIPIMRRQKSGNVINVSSIAARHGGGGGAIVYAGAKGFVATATRGWAKEVVGDGIRVNAVSPGVITTPFHERYSTAEQLKAMQATIPMNRLGTAEECAGTFLYLASDALSGYVTGQNVEVNGGQYMP